MILFHIAGLEQLKNEHNDILNSLYQSLKMVKKDKGDSNLVEEKTRMIEKSLESLELGLGEAKVSPFLILWVWLLLFSDSILCILYKVHMKETSSQPPSLTFVKEVIDMNNVY